TNSLSDDINYLNENTIFEKAEAIANDVKIGDKIISNITNKKISIKKPLNTEGVLGKVKSNIYHTLLYYWNTSNIHNNTRLMTSLLNSYYKELDFVKLEDKKDKIIQMLRNEFNEIKSNNSLLAAEQLDLIICLLDADAESSMYL
ncbi:13331_t:CDS:1, partial [Funneliformis geosporum]